MNIKLKILTHARKHRGDYVTAAALVALQRTMQHTHTKWDEYKLDFKMYDEFAKKRRKK